MVNDVYSTAFSWFAKHYSRSLGTELELKYGGAFKFPCYIYIYIIFFFLLQKMKLTIVTSPRKLPFLDQDNRELKVINPLLTWELRTHKRWTAACTRVLQHHPKCMFLYDRLEFSVKNAFGADCKIALNPCMIMCYHPACVENCNGPHKLRHMFQLNEFLLHLEDHVDEIGIDVLLRSIRTLF